MNPEDQRFEDAANAINDFVKYVLDEIPEVGQSVEWELEVMDEGGSVGEFRVTVERMTEGE